MTARKFRGGNRKRAAAGSDTPGTASTAAKAGGAGAASKPSKYNAKGRFVGTVWMASDAQATRYEQLLQMEADGTIERLRVEVSYPLMVGGVKIATYRADAVYDVIDLEARTERTIVEEVKGMETPEWKLKKRLFAALYPHFTLAVITRPQGAAAWAKEPLEPLMVGKKSSFSEWIKVRWAGNIPT